MDTGHDFFPLVLMLTPPPKPKSLLWIHKDTWYFSIIQYVIAGRQYSPQTVDWNPHSPAAEPERFLVFTSVWGYRNSSFGSISHVFERRCFEVSVETIKKGYVLYTIA